MICAHLQTCRAYGTWTSRTRHWAAMHRYRTASIQFNSTNFCFGIMFCALGREHATTPVDGENGPISWQYLTWCRVNWLWPG